LISFLPGGWGGRPCKKDLGPSWYIELEGTCRKHLDVFAAYSEWRGPKSEASRRGGRRNAAWYYRKGSRRR